MDKIINTVIKNIKQNYVQRLTETYYIVHLPKLINRIILDNILGTLADSSLLKIIELFEREIRNMRYLIDK